MTKSLVATIVMTLLASPATAQERAGDIHDIEIHGSSFFAVQVADADAAADWYGRNLGLAEVRRIDDEGGRFAIRLLTRPGLMVELIQQAGATAAGDGRKFGLFKVGFSVTDIEALHSLLGRRSVDVDDSIFTDEALAARSFVFRDPYGNRIQVFEPCTDCQGDAP